MNAIFGVLKDAPLRTGIIFSGAVITSITGRQKIIVISLEEVSFAVELAISRKALFTQNTLAVRTLHTVHVP